MIPADFPQANTVYGPPEGLEETQVGRIPAFVGTLQTGSCDGSRIVVTAWTPTLMDIQRIIEGKPIFITFMGGLPPHVPTTDFSEAVNIA